MSNLGGFLLKKLLSSFLALALAVIAIVQFDTHSAVADTRITGAVTGKTVFIGSPSTISATATIGERAATAEWANFKFEIRAVQKATFSVLAVFSQQNTAPCGGTTSSPSGSSVTCTVALTSTRNVLYATNSVGTGAISNSLKITQTSGDSQLFRIRGWIDRNNNDQIDAYEPATTIQTVNTVDPRKAKAFYNFEVDPPRYTEGKVTGWIANGGLSNKATDLMDPTLISMKVHSCGPYSCTRISGATTYNFHPQLMRYELTTNVPTLSLGTYAVELYYQQDANNIVLLDTRIFDYKQRAPLGVKTEIVPQSGTALMPTGISAGTPSRLNTTMAGPGVSSFTYKATFSDEDKSLISNRPVYVFINAIDLVSTSQLRVNGMQVSTSNQDQIILRRDTDANGVLTLNIQYAGRSMEQLRIDVQVNGLRPYEFAYPGSEEAFVWDTTPVRTINLSSSSTSASSASPLTLTATVNGSLGGVANDGSVIFFGDPGFTFDTPVVPLAVGTSATSIVRVSNLAGEKGTGFVYAQTLSAAGWITAKLQLSWKDYGNELVVGEFAPVVIPVSQPNPSISVAGKLTTVNVSGLIQSDSVVIWKNGVPYSPIFSADHTSATKSFATGTKTSTFLVYVNGKLVLKRSSR